MKAYKAHEERTAAAVSGERVSAPWRKGPDVVSDWIVAECKSREKLPQWIVNAVRQAADAAGEYQLPVAVLHQKYQRSKDDLVVMRLEDFLAWFGGNGNGDLPDDRLPEQE